MTYSFGDTDLAGRRLDLVSRVFDPPSRAFLERTVPPGVGLAVDLGCGPGNTTLLVRETVSPRRLPRITKRRATYWSNVRSSIRLTYLGLASSSKRSRA